MAVKRRVGFRIEPYQRARTVEKGRKQGTENGLGAAWAKCKSAKPATGTPVKASGCTPREPSSAPAAAALRLCPQGCGKPRWYHGSFKLPSLQGVCP